ncbi:MAG: hypothetical protein Q8P18_02700, partial [Pseudomonadota bacterium]|nr:hypothetical protein [Pseudomonadota bacterium]
MWHVKDSGAAPVANLTARYGFGSRWDLGLRLGTAGVGVASKFTLTNLRSRTWAVAVAPSVSTVPFGQRPLHLQLPLLVGLGIGPHELTIAPKLQGWSSVRTFQA